MIQKLILSLFLVCSVLVTTQAKPDNMIMENPAKKQFVYVLHLMPTYQKEANWTGETNTIIGTHFNYLKDLTEKGTVIMAGRSDYEVSHKDVFGMVVFEAENEKAARELMLNDPAVKAQIMKAELHPFSLALLKK